MAKPVTTPQVKKDSLPEAWIYRADFLSSKVFHIRFGVLNGNTVELYKGDHMVLENAFPLADAKISSVRAAECDVKPQGVNMLKGYFDGSIESKCLHILRLRVPRTQSILHNKLILGFDTQENALFWHGKLSTAILTGVSASHQRSTSGDRSSVEQIHADDSGPLDTDDQPCPSVPREDSSRSTVEWPSAAARPPPPPPPREPLLPRAAPTNPYATWEPQFNMNGLAGFREPVEGTYATCCGIGASPAAVFRHLVRLADGSSAWAFLEDVRVLSAPSADANGLVFQARLGAATRWQRWLSRLGLLAPRDVVLQQAWQLRDEHGVVLLSFHSVEHKAAPPPPRRRSWTDVFTQWLQPVRAQVHRLAFTIAPLAPELWDSTGRAPEDAPECMLTMLVSADLGGAFARGSPLATLTPALSLLWLEPLVKSIIKVRDSVHHKRFVEPMFRVFGSSPRADAVANAAARAASLRRGNSSMRLSLAASAAAAVAAVPDAAAPASVDGSAGGGDGGAPIAEAEEPVGWLPVKYYYSPDGSEFKVRGPRYLTDKRKQPSAQPAFRLKAMEALTTDGHVAHISPYLPVVAHSSAPFLLPIHFTLPHGGRPTHLVLVFEADADPTADEGGTGVADGDGPFACALAEFLTGATPEDDRRRNSMLKLIPMVRDGGWLMRQAVGTTPVIIGNKLATTYHRGAHYLEATIDIASNATAAGIANLVAGSVSNLAIWLGFVLEGKKGDHLPERLLGTVCLDHLDLSAARHLDVSKPLPPRSPAAQPPQASAPPPQQASAAAAMPRPSALASVPEASSGADGSEASPLVDAAASSGGASASSGGSGRASPYELVEAPLKRPQAL